MATETTREMELKFTPSPEVQAKLKSVQSPSQLISVLKGAFNLGEYEFGPETRILIVDRYFDNATLDFFRSHAALRVRQKGASFELTMKIPRAHEIGISDRNEHTLTTSADKIEELESNGFAPFLSDVSASYCRPGVRHVLTISNSRTMYELRRGDVVFELCLDKFVASRPNKKSLRSESFEIEIEAKTQEAREKLAAIKENVARVVPTLKTEDRSKYEQSVVSLGLDRTPFGQWCQSVYDSANFGTWLGVVVSVVGLLLGIIQYFMGLPGAPNGK